MQAGALIPGLHLALWRKGGTYSKKPMLHLVMAP